MQDGGWSCCEPLAGLAPRNPVRTPANKLQLHRLHPPPLPSRHRSPIALCPHSSASDLQRCPAAPRPSARPEKGKAESAHTHGFEVLVVALLAFESAVQHHILQVVADPRQELLHVENFGFILLKIGLFLEDG